MDVVLVVPVRARPQHRRKPCAGRMQHVLAQLPRHGAVGQRNRAAIGKLEGADIERIGAAVFGKQGTGNSVAASALEGIEIVEVRDRAAELLRQRRDIAADPVGDRRRHAATEDCRWLHRHLPLVGQHDRLQPHQILAAAAAGTMDVGNAGSDGDFLRQRLPARRRLRLGRRLLIGFGGLGRRRFRGRGLLGGGCRRLRRARLRQRHRRAVRGAPLPWRRSGFEQVGPRCRHGPARRHRRLGLHAEQNGYSGNHGPFGAAKRATSPFSACFLRARVHVNFMIDCRATQPGGSGERITGKNRGGTCVCLA